MSQFFGSDGSRLNRQGSHSFFDDSDCNHDDLLNAGSTAFGNNSRMFNVGNSSFTDNSMITRSGNTYYAGGKQYTQHGNTLFCSDGRRWQGYGMTDQDIRNIIFEDN